MKKEMGKISMLKKKINQQIRVVNNIKTLNFIKKFKMKIRSLLQRILNNNKLHHQLKIMQKINRSQQSLISVNVIIELLSFFKRTVL